MGGLEPQAAAVGEAWEMLTGAERTLDHAAMDAGERAARLELVEFHLGELQKARLTPGEDDELAQSREVLRHAGRLTTLCGEAYAPALRRRIGGTLRRWARYGSGSASWRRSTRCSRRTLAARDGIKAQLEDLALTLRDYQQRLDASPARLQEVEDRLALIERLKRKHGPSLADVLAKAAALEQERAALDAGPGHRAGRRGGGRRAAGVSWPPPAACRRAPRMPARDSPRRSSASSPTWRWPGPASSCA